MLPQRLISPNEIIVVCVASVGFNSSHLILWSSVTESPSSSDCVGRYRFCLCCRLSRTSVGALYRSLLSAETKIISIQLLFVEVQHSLCSLFWFSPVLLLSFKTLAPTGRPQRFELSFEFMLNTFGLCSLKTLQNC